MSLPCLLSYKAKQPLQRGLIGACIRKIVKCPRCRLNDVTLDERCALARALFRTLDAALPLHDSPAIEPVLRQLGKDRAKTPLPAAKRAESSCAICPRLEPAVDTLASTGTELRILHVKH